ncbi:MBL fold metallo-hydrolase [Clostridium guangxiense]|uniref:MBL fold metallo-hydrolase n=1 Tax=Clostridium guangxiense TaxID=1662055 RepID=UPI001E51295F|nr:MBL fold metallo-hydrolase [Clostridium guangxiense]MCD2345315.1 MBL fold metallo-hydrolase [Clostridium guangxiense]
MKIGIIPVGSYMTNCYIVIDEITNESIIIDPGDDAERLLDEFNKTGSHLNFIILTHGHADHTAAVAEFRSKYAVDVYMSKKDSELIEKEEYMFGEKNENANKFIKDGDVLKFGSKNVKCIETPGHTPGGMCYLIENSLFSGDTLFNNSVGRTDFPGGDYAAIISSIKNKLMKLDDNIKVYPGHGSETTIGFERRSNPFL